VFMETKWNMENISCIHKNSWMQLMKIWKRNWAF